MKTEEKQERKPRFWKVFGYVFLLIFIFAAFSIVGFTLKSSTIRGVVGAMLGQKPEAVFGDETLTLLILGCDEDRYYGGKQILSSAARSDMMLLAKLNFNRHTISALSIPRDLLVEHSKVGVSLPRRLGRSSRINAFHAHGGPDMSEQVVENLFDIQVDRTIVLNFEAFKELIDLLGGIEVFIQKDMVYKDVRGGLDINLKKGRHTLNGTDAMGYVRFRKGAGESDFTRQDRQKELMMAVKDKILNQPTLIPVVADKTVEILDNRLTGGELGSLIWFAQKVPTEGVKMGTIPVTEPPRRGGAFYLYLDDSELYDTLVEYGFKGRNSAGRSGTAKS